MPRALISVWDKSGIVDLATRLSHAGFEVVSTGGTARLLSDAGLTVVEVSDLTGFPEMLDGRVKTLHPAVHAGLLALRDNAAHLQTLQDHNLGTIDLLVGNLYPFASVVSTEDIDDENAIENIDIGGPAMLRSAAKNHAGVVVLVDPSDYEGVLAAIESTGLDGVSIEERRRLAAVAFGHVSHYDSLVARYLRTEDEFPRELTFGGRLLSEVKYGENPHQRAAVYAMTAPGIPVGVGTWTAESGGELSYNNYLDASAAWSTVQAFDDPAVVIVKHTLPCGAGTHDDLAEAYRLAFSGDPVSAFGGVLACNRTVTGDMAKAIGRHLLHVIIAPGYEPEALERLRKKRSMRVVTVGETRADRSLDIRGVPGGFLVQEQDRVAIDAASWNCVTERQPTSDELRSLEFAWRVIPFVKSNAIVLAMPDHVVGMGAGQPNRVESVRIAVKVAGDRVAGCGLASDAFFPFPDGIEAAAEAGVTAIIQPGGSVKDDECVTAANAHGVAMLFSGVRHFRH